MTDQEIEIADVAEMGALQASVLDAAGALGQVTAADAPARSPDLPAPGRRMPIEALGQVELKVEVVLGRARLRLHELLDVRPGQSLELDRSRNSPVDVLVNGTLFARGDIVVIDDTNLGVRVSEVIGSGDLAKEGR